MSGKLQNPQVLSAEVPWQSYNNDGIISREQLELIYCYDKQPVPTQARLFSNTGETYVEVFSTLLLNVNTEETVQYVLALLEEVLGCKPDLANYWHSVLRSTGGANDPFLPCMRLLTRKDIFILEKATCILGRLLSYQPKISFDDVEFADALVLRHTGTFLEWIMFKLQGAESADFNANSAFVYALSGLQALVCAEKGRTAFIHVDGLPTLCGLINTEPADANQVQLLYQVVFCLWCLSFSKDVAKNIVESDAELINKLVGISAHVAKEKVVRVCMATLRNLLNIGDANHQMVTAGIMKVLAQLHARKWADDDIMDDIDRLIEVLEVNMAKLSSFEMYTKELMSGKLEWSPCHKNVVFWKDNVKNFTADDNTVLKMLVDIVTNEKSDAESLAIACYDIGEFVRHHPEGRRIMNTMSVKAHIMALMKHENSEVQKYALTSVQKLMVINWEYLNIKDK